MKIFHTVKTASKQVALGSVFLLSAALSPQAGASVTYTYTGILYDLADGTTWTTAMNTVIEFTLNMMPTSTTVNLLAPAPFIVESFFWDDGVYTFNSLTGLNSWSDATYPLGAGSVFFATPLQEVTFDGDGEVIDWDFERITDALDGTRLELDSDGFNGEDHTLGTADTPNVGGFAFTDNPGIWDKVVETTPANNLGQSLGVGVFALALIPFAWTRYRRNISQW